MKKLVLFTILILLPMMAIADDSGTCGENLTWTYIEATKTLTISGTGDMKDYSSYSSVPWYSYRNNIVNVNIGKGVTSIGNNAFYFCSVLTSIEIPNNVTTIGEHAFYCCSVTSINIPNSVTSIGGGVFGKCYKLTSVTIPNSVTSIGDGAFRDCVGLTSIEIPNSVASIGSSAFYGCTGLTSIVIPDSVTIIGWGTFYKCTGLTSVVIGNSVTTIENEAFAGCEALNYLTIGNSVSKIGSYAFSGCDRIVSIYLFVKDPPSINSYSAFTDVAYKYTCLYIPQESYEAYSNGYYWKYFKKIKALNENDHNIKIEGDINGDGVISVTDVGILITKILQGE